MLPHCRRSTLARVFATLLAGLAGAAAVHADTSRVNVANVAILGTQTTAIARPRGELVLGTNGNIYFTSEAGGSTGLGTVSTLAPDGTVTVLHSFAGADTEGTSPYAGVIQASDGNFYGTTYLGGARNLGTVYRISPSGDFANLASFTNESQGGFLPYAALVQHPNGDLYGTTLRGGTNDAGTIFRITLAGNVTVLRSFAGADGRNPEGKLVVGTDGALYGTTLIGGAADRGTVYRITPDGATFTTLYSFPSLGAFNAAGVATNATGANPRAGLTRGADGNFYGTAYQGGAGGYGTVYRMTPSGSVTNLHDFEGAPFDGGYPLSAVNQLPDGTLVGTTEKGGAAGNGSVWSISPSGQYTHLHSLSFLPLDGGQSYISLLPFNGQLYGATSTDFTYSAGAIFRIERAVNGVLPITISATPDRLTTGGTVTVTWNGAAYPSCSAGGEWEGTTIGVAGTQTFTPGAGIRTYSLLCTDAAGAFHNAYATVFVAAPEAKPVDGGGDGGGGGATDPLLLAALAGFTAFTLVRRHREFSRRTQDRP